MLEKFVQPFCLHCPQTQRENLLGPFLNHFLGNYINKLQQIYKEGASWITCSLEYQFLALPTPTTKPVDRTEIEMKELLIEDIRIQSKDSLFAFLHIIWGTNQAELKKRGVRDYSASSTHLTSVRDYIFLMTVGVHALFL